MQRRDCIARVLLACFAFVLMTLLAGCGGGADRSSSNVPPATSNPPASNPPAPGTPPPPGGTPSSSEHVVYALNGNQVFVFDAHPTQGTLQSVAGPIATTLVNAAAIAFDAPQRTLFAVGFVCMPRGDCGNSMAALSTLNPQSPSLLNAQQTTDTSDLLVDSTGLLPIGLNPVNAFQSWRYDPGAHTFTAVGDMQAFQTGKRAEHPVAPQPASRDRGNLFGSGFGAFHDICELVPPRPRQRHTDEVRYPYAA